MNRLQISDLPVLLGAVIIVLSLLAWIYLLATEQATSPYVCPPGYKEVSGWSGGRYTHLCMQP